MAGRSTRWTSLLNRLELTRRSGLPLDPFLVVQAVECCERLGCFELAVDWLRSSRRTAIELFCATADDECEPRERSVSAEALELASVRGGATLLVHGVRHGARDRAVVEAIVRAAPVAVALEGGGEDAAPGATLERAEACQLGLIAAELAACRPAYASAAGWLGAREWDAVLRARGATTESLAIVAAWACGARVVSVDRPKGVTWARAVAGHSAAELDNLFAQKVRDGYPRSRFVLDERDTVMCAALRALTAASPTGARVVAVVGAAHAEPIVALWHGLDASRTRAAALALAASAALATPPLPAAGEVALRAALLDEIYAPSARPSRHLPPLVDAQAIATYSATRACYAGADMRLAVLSRDELGAHVLDEQRREAAATAGGAGAEVGARARALADAVWESLEPARAARPVNGGPGYVTMFS
jgi:hypothetical protein